jgi:hypothetical protein
MSGNFVDSPLRAEYRITGLFSVSSKFIKIKAE